MNKSNNKNNDFYLYRFIPLRNQTDFDRLINLINNGMYHFSDPTTQNDPFDCFCKINLNVNDKCAHDELYDVIKKQNPEWYHLEIENEIKLISKTCINTPILSNQLFESFYSNLHLAGICCFSSKLYNTLMWSHYASSHTGVALQFSFSNIEQSLSDHELGMIKKVEYSFVPPETDFFGGDNLDKVIRVVFTKSKKWSYEKEYRVLIPEIDDSNRLLKITSIKVRNIYLGCKLSNEYKLMLVDSINSSHNIYQLKMRSDRYAYKRQSISDILIQ